MCGHSAAQPQLQSEHAQAECIGVQGTTTILMTQVPHFRELVIYSFECPHCNNR